MSTEFHEYKHLERLNTSQVRDIELGKCYIFPKLDGTNASVWMDSDNFLCAGSRKRQLSTTKDKDNAGFCKFVMDSDEIADFMFKNPNLRLFGEWLVPHTLKTYKESAWRQFYIFDVYDHDQDKYLHYDEYAALLEDAWLNIIPPLIIITRPSHEQLLEQCERNTYLIQDDKGCGEGIVIKNYEFFNRYDRQEWAKLVTSDFKDKYIEKMGCGSIGGKMVEESIVDKYITQHLVDKTYAKIDNAQDGWTCKSIPELLNRVFHDFIDEEMWDVLKSNKFPIINFRTLNGLAIRKIKELRPELF